ncbi:eukaryotic aspartyl protease family protein [Stylonychia lemnae]|uniref:Eukaryotic aspartyl protease family protein n=1 Tax=Stylonychia lemnae TaxID=5949 RepID=A0A078A8U6_STYLE|nr:eukaryotic aspartyl protease family protein [Stylonychia lemnae]|eukprot:CDW78695.1 eukaryotic aspartyl protease family protein [Stylonychia lemnae]
MIKSFSIVSMLLAPLVLSQTFKVEVTRSEAALPEKLLQQSKLNKEFEVAINRFSTYRYTGKFYFGSKASDADLILDTDSDWMLVESQQCDACLPTHRRYNPLTSTTQTPGSNETFILYLDDNFYVGDDYYDTVCVADSSKYCAKDFKFIAVTDINKVTSELAKIDGVVGLGPDDPSNGPSFIAELYNQGVIGKKMFGIQVGFNQKSEMMFGGWDDTWMKTRGENIYFYPQSNQSRWEIELRDLKMKNTSFWEGSKKAVIDSFNDSITFPDAEFQVFKTYIESIDHTIDCDNTKGTCRFNDDCTTKYTKLPQLRIQFGDMNTFAINPKDYLFGQVDGGNRAFCTFLIKKNNKDYVQIGQPFLKNFYAIFDFESGSVGFFLHAYTNSEVNSDGVERVVTPQPPITDDSPSDDKFPIWAIILIVVVLIGGLLALGAVAFIKIRNKRLQQNLSQYNQLEGTKGKAGKTLQ